MNQWAFVIAAYSVAAGATALLLAWSFAAMRSAEAEAERLRSPE